MVAAILVIVVVTAAILLVVILVLVGLLNSIFSGGKGADDAIGSAVLLGYCVLFAGVAGLAATIIWSVKRARRKRS